MKSATKFFISDERLIDICPICRIIMIQLSGDFNTAELGNNPATVILGIPYEIVILHSRKFCPDEIIVISCAFQIITADKEGKRCHIHCLFQWRHTCLFYTELEIFRYDKMIFCIQSRYTILSIPVINGII